MIEPETQPAIADEEPRRTADTAGARLTVARRSQNLSSSDVARQLKLSVRQVEALEHDDYSSFSGPVFVRGFLRNYAKLLHVDADELLAIALPAPATAEAAIAQEPRAAGSSSERPRRFLAGSLLVVLAVVAIVLLASHASRDHLPSTASNSVPALHPAMATGASAQPPAPASPAPSPLVSEAMQRTPEPAAGPAPQPPDLTGAPSAASLSEPPGKPVVTGSGPEHIKLVFEAQAWVQIKDGNGITLLSRLNPADSERVVRGTPPFSVVVGNAPNVRLTYHDKVVDLQPHTKVDVARITLE